MGTHVTTKPAKSTQPSTRSHQHRPKTTPPKPTHHLLRLQQSIGNQAVLRLLQAQGAQAKLNISQPNDPYEKEADRVADQVMRMPDPKPAEPTEKEETTESLTGQTQSPPTISPIRISRLVQRQAEPSETQPIEEEMVEDAPLLPLENGPLVQRQTTEEPEEELAQPLRVDRQVTKESEEEPVQALHIGRQTMEDAEEEPVQTFRIDRQDMKNHDEKPEQIGLKQSLKSEEEQELQMKSNRTVLQKQEVQYEKLLQRKSARSESVTSFEGGKGNTANQTGIPDPLKAGLEQLSGTDLSSVRVHYNSSKPSQLNALAYTQGQDIHVGPGQEKHLPHEGWHVVQQVQGRVAPTMHAKGVSINDDASLEREADVMGRKALQIRRPEKIANTALTIRHLETIQDGLHPIQAKKKTTYVPYKIHVKQLMTQEEFRLAAMRQIFGGVLTNVEWRNSKDSYVPENSPYTVQVSTKLLKQQRSQVSKERGISLEEDGGVTGAEERAKMFHAGPDSDQKSKLMTEIDRRYFEAIGDKTETKIKAGEKGKAELWLMIRDEVLFQHDYIANMPPQVKELIRFSTKGKDLKPVDYDKLFAIVRKIESLPPGHVGDYASKVSGSTTDLDAFDASLDRYIAETAEREKQSEAREKIHTKLIGLEEVYKKYQLYEDRRKGPGTSMGLQALKVRQELEHQLQAHGFAGVTEFEAFIKRFEQAFEQEAANIANDLIGKYEGTLYRESQRYQDRAQVESLHGQLSGVRSEYNAQQTHQKEVQRLQQQRWMGAHQTYVPPKSQEQKHHEAKVEEHKQGTKLEVAKLAQANPIFNEEHLPSDKQIDKGKLSSADVDGLQALLLAHLDAQAKDAREARAEIKGKTELIYKMDKLMPQFYVQMGIKPGSIHDMIIQEKMKSDAIVKLLKGIALAVVAVALAVVTFGAATPAIIAVGAGVAGAGLGVYTALEEYQEYTQQKNLADVGLAANPSIIWLVVAVVGATLDMTAAAKAVGALGKAAKALEAGGELSDFMKAVKAAEEAKEIEFRIARAAEKAGRARKGFAEASTELTKAMSGKLYSFPGPLADPDVYKAVVKMARQAIKAKIYDAQKFIDELKLARVKAGLGDLTPEELAKAKQAWEEAKVLEASDVAIQIAEQSRVGKYTTRIHWGILDIEARPHTTIKGAFWGKRTPQPNPRVDAYELKINPNNESFFLSHPSGGYVQFEQLVGTSLVQDGKLVIKTRSIYHVADMPPFAKEKVLAEARRQVAAASDAGLSVEWLVSDARAMLQLDALFKKEGIAVTLRSMPE